MNSAEIIEPELKLEDLAGELSDHMLDLLDKGASPQAMAEASLIASLPLLLEVTRAKNIEHLFHYLASIFDGNDRRRCDSMN